MRLLGLIIASLMLVSCTETGVYQVKNLSGQYVTVVDPSKQRLSYVSPYEGKQRVNSETQAGKHSVRGSKLPRSQMRYIRYRDKNGNVKLKRVSLKVFEALKRKVEARKMVSEYRKKTLLGRQQAYQHQAMKSGQLPLKMNTTGVMMHRSNGQPKVTPKVHMQGTYAPPDLGDKQNMARKGTQSVVISGGKLLHGKDIKLAEPDVLSRTSPQLNAVTGGAGKVVPSAMSVSVGRFMAYDSSCTVARVPQIEVVKQPAHGRAWARTVKVVVKSGKCQGYVVPSVIVYYRSKDGYKGADNFIIQGRGLPGSGGAKVTQSNITLNVK